MEQKSLGGFDYFKIICAFLVVAIHTSPLASVNTEVDFIFARIVGRVAVPFFLMVSGYFLLPQYLFEKSMDMRPMWKFLKKICLLYGMAIIIYLPVNYYAGQLYVSNVTSVFRMIAFDGTFYHLWYFSAVIIGILLVCFIGRYLPFSILGVLCTGLYFIGMFGDSYYGLIANTIVENFYKILFGCCSYTRNGLFYAPIFLLMGAWIKTVQCRFKKKVCMIGFFVSLLLMVGEGMVLHHIKVQRHDSMYLMLLPCMFFLFQTVAAWEKKPSKKLRVLSTWIYLLHPLCIIGVRGIAKMTHLEAVLIENSVIHYLSVCILTTTISVFIEKCISTHKVRESVTGRAWIELDKKGLYQNVDALCRFLPNDCQLMPAIKANAYGHGSVLIAKALQEKGIQSFCVASIKEGIELRKNGITGEILILGYTYPEQFSSLRKYRLSQTVVDFSYAQSLNAYGKKMKVHLKIDTGMHRLGERAEEIREIKKIFQYENLVVDGIYTHLCVSDGISEEEKTYTCKQADIFLELLQKLRDLGIVIPKKHLCASYGLLHYPELLGDYARVGIAIYGLLSHREDKERCPISLMPVLSVKARISIVKNLYKGESAGYGLQYTAEENRRIAVLSIGYADGLPRMLSCGVGRVLINGYIAPIIGRICMDQTLVDITDVPNVKQGDIAVLIGKSGDLEITAYDLAEQTGTITNEIVSRLGTRLERKMS